MRGELTERVSKVAMETLGWQITHDELRLVPYLHFSLVNAQRLDPSRIKPCEREVLSLWRERGWLVSGGAGGDLVVTKEFWDAMNEILWVSYVAYGD